MQTPELLSDPVFHDEDAARAYLENTRWPEYVTCPLCGSLDKIAPVAGESMGKGWWYCGSCKDKFTVRVGSVMERSHIPLHKWLLAFRLMASSKKGCSAHQLHRTLGITYKSAWFLAHRIREAMRPENPAPLGGEGKIVEADETFITKRLAQKWTYLGNAERAVQLVSGASLFARRHQAEGQEPLMQRDMRALHDGGERLSASGGSRRPVPALVTPPVNQSSI